jgi:uncharacterized protein (UPF0261 family)
MRQLIRFVAMGCAAVLATGLVATAAGCGVVDVTTTEWCDEVVGGVLSAGPDRLGAAARKGIPQVVSVGALDMVNFGGIETMPDRFRTRNIYKHNATVTLMRTTPEENREIGRRIAAQLNKATGPTVVVLPLKGVSMLDSFEKQFYDPQADAALFETLRQSLNDNIRLLEVDAHINDPVFAEIIADNMLELLQAGADSRNQ